METLHIDNMMEQSSSGNNPNEQLEHFSVSAIIGNNVFNPKGENLGQIKDIVFEITKARIEYVVIEFGGFLGMNQKYFAVPLKDLKVAKEHRNAFLLNETKDSLKRYPEFDNGHWPNNSHEESLMTSNEDGFVNGGTKG